MREIEFRISPEDFEDRTLLTSDIAKAYGIAPAKIKEFRIIKRSLDARFRPPVYQLRVLVSEEDALPPVPNELQDLPDVSRAREVHIIGAGPAGYFAALECIRQGLRPVIFERGKDVQARRKDLRAIQQDGIVNPNSNYCFGEGGAGTYSDGKLYTRSGKRGNIDKVLRILVECGANKEILMEAHPHIGSNKLPGIIANMRQVIESHGGSVLFDSRITSFLLEGDGQRRISGVEINGTDRIKVETLILATGHSARDIFQMCLDHHIRIEPKPFALGVRIEHSQNFVDLSQYGVAPRGPYLPAASYALNAQAGNRGVFSFCMCPGGLIVPAATSPGEIVVNGMSLSRRDSPYANSGVVTAIELDDLKEYLHAGDLMGVAFQREVEQRMFAAGNGSQAAPAQRLTDFIRKQVSAEIPTGSYIPGFFSAPLHELLPSWVYERLVYGLKGFDHKMPGYIDHEALVVATESRTSSPVRIPRHSANGMHIEVEGLFPCGEGAGYAGGILSAAMDGQFIASAVKNHIEKT
jgi:uncharacterized FAD-dependent dehydrogenase